MGGILPPRYVTVCLALHSFPQGLQNYIGDLSIVCLCVARVLRLQTQKSPACFAVAYLCPVFLFSLSLFLFLSFLCSVVVPCAPAPILLSSSIAAVLHAPVRLVPESMCFVAYQGDDHAVEVEEEHDEVEAEFDEGFLMRGVGQRWDSRFFLFPS